MDSQEIVTLVAAIIGSGGISGLLAYVLGGRNERKRDERTAGREREALHERQADDARTFQRDTLLELHDQLYKINRVTGRIFHADQVQFAKTRRFGYASTPDGTSEEHSVLQASINRLRVRIFDPELRALVRVYTDELIGTINPWLAHGLAREPGDDKLMKMAADRINAGSVLTWNALEDKLGEAIRMQFPGSDIRPELGMTFRPVPQPRAAGQESVPASRGNG